MRIAIGNDHAAIEMENTVVDHLLEKGSDVLDLGTGSSESCGYPVYNEKIGRTVVSGEADLGTAVCDTGVRISLTANKVKGTHVCVCSKSYTAKLSRMHDDSNVLAFSARVIGAKTAKVIAGEWLDAEYQGGKHQRWVDMVMDIENRQKDGCKISGIAF